MPGSKLWGMTKRTESLSSKKNCKEKCQKEKTKILSLGKDAIVSRKGWTKKGNKKGKGTMPHKQPPDASLCDWIYVDMGRAMATFKLGKSNVSEKQTTKERLGGGGFREGTRG